jgi:hypothetical protein
MVNGKYSRLRPLFHEIYPNSLKAAAAEYKSLALRQIKRGLGGNEGFELVIDNIDPTMAVGHV